ncbi:MAG: SDR family oxidoreductase [Hyphomicrobium sp.]
MLRLTDNSALIRAGVAVVTGAGAGLGRALAIELANRDVRVVGFGRNKSTLDGTAALISSGRFVSKVVDVGDEQAVRAAFADVRAEAGDVTLLINNAAVYPRLDFLAETPASFMKTIEVNLGGVVACTHAALDTMTQTSVGRIVNVGSFAGLAPIPASAAYSVSKAAAIALGKALTADLSDRFPNIVITTWMPGVLATDMGLPNGLDPAIAARWGATLALWHDPSLNGAIFERDQELIEHRSIKRRIKDLILLRRRPAPRRLAVEE